MSKTKNLKISFLWNTLERFGVQGFQFVISIILARMLTPKDFGIIGMISIFITISQVFIESGFSKALIFKQDRTNRDFSTVFYFNLLLSILLVIILWNLAEVIANFYKTKELILAIKVLSISLVINALSLTQNVKLEIEMNFKKKAQINIVSIIFSGLISVILAFNNFGIWALIIQNLIKNILMTIFYFIYNKWLPEFYFCLTSLKVLYKYSYRLLISGLIGTIFNQIYGIIIGRVYSIQELGYYSRGNQISETISGTISSVVQTVTFPLFCSMKDDEHNFFKNFKQINRIIIMIILPTMLLLAILADSFIVLLLTEKWRGAAMILKWSALGYIFTPISSLNMGVLNAKGRTDLFLRLDFIKIPLVIGMMLVTFPFGIKAFMIGRFICSGISFFINSYYPGKIFDYDGLSQIKDTKDIICSSLIMAIVVNLLIKYMEGNIWKVFLGGSVGLVVYIISLFLFSNPEVSIIKKLLNKKNYLSK